MADNEKYNESVNPQPQYDERSVNPQEEAEYDPGNDIPETSEED